MVSKQTPHVSIIILNWNGWQDTIECLESVFKLNYKNYTVLIFDNGSENESISKIIDWADGRKDHRIITNFDSLVYPIIPKPIKHEVIDFEYEKRNVNKIKLPESKGNFFIIKSKSNLGFAIANNVVMKIVERKYNSKYYFLLNNDIVIHPDAVTELINSLENDKSVKIAQSAIYKYNNPEVIANAGGKILCWGQTKYYKKIKKDTVKEISFINGCALMINAEIIQKYGYLSEKFFFGEEDFEFSMRMKQNKIKMICVADSKVYHKIGSTVNQYAKIKKRIFIHGMNRLIDLKDFYSPFVWYLWKEGMFIYYFLTLLIRHHFSLNESIEFIRELRYYSKINTDVKKKTLDNIFSQTTLWKIN